MMKIILKVENWTLLPFSILWKREGIHLLAKSFWQFTSEIVSLAAKIGCLHLLTSVLPASP